MTDSTCPSGFFLLDSGFCCPFSCKSKLLPETDGLCPVGFYLIVGKPEKSGCCPYADAYKEDVSGLADYFDL